MYLLNTTGMTMNHIKMVRNKDFIYRNSSQFMQEGPLDALNSPSYIDLKNGQTKP